MNNIDYTVTFACYNQLDYTKQFIASLDRKEVDFSRIVAVDNGSTDGTREWLVAQDFGKVILNKRNLGCGAAWNQGALSIQSKWTIVMNNDVICCKGWLHNLLNVAEKNDLQIISPAMIEGNLDYDFDDWAVMAQRKMEGYLRENSPHAVCMGIREDVWDAIGYFMPIPKLLGYEDSIFFQRAKEAKIKTATSAASWLHHFGMITQKALKIEMKLEERGSLGNRNLMRMYMNQSWFDRKISRIFRRFIRKSAHAYELSSFGMTVHGINRKNNEAWEWD